MRRLLVLTVLATLLGSAAPVNAVAPVQTRPGGSADARAADRYTHLAGDRGRAATRPDPRILDRHNLRDPDEAG